MAAEEHKRWAEFDQRLKQAEKRILATGNLVRAGIPMIVDLQARLDARGCTAVWNNWSNPKRGPASR
jgi:hypothetical protein